MENGVLGGSFRPAPDCDFTETAESCGIRRAHPGCPRERSSQSAKNRSSTRWPGRQARGWARCGRRRGRAVAGTEARPPADTARRAMGDGLESRP